VCVHNERRARRTLTPGAGVHGHEPQAALAPALRVREPNAAHPASIWSGACAFRRLLGRESTDAPCRTRWMSPGPWSSPRPRMTPSVVSVCPEACFWRYTRLSVCSYLSLNPHEQFRMLSKPCSVVRDVTVTTTDMLRAAADKSSMHTRAVMSMLCRCLSSTGADFCAVAQLGPPGVERASSYCKRSNTVCRRTGSCSTCREVSPAPSARRARADFAQPRTL
jgi:hypothetical protein